MPSLRAIAQAFRFRESIFIAGIRSTAVNVHHSQYPKQIELTTT